VQAANDPFLTPDCFCDEIAAEHLYLHLEITERGGHCGFMQQKARHSWAEERAFRFVTTQLTPQ
jgi:predicted alpha/beta-fold hydrolase